MFTGQYELRGRLNRVGNLGRSALNGIVVAGTPRDPWTVVGVNGRGELTIMKCESVGGGVNNRALQLDIDLGPAIERDEDPILAVRVLSPNTLSIRIDDRDPVEVELPYDLPKRSHPGIFTKSGRTELVDFVIEVFP